MQGLCMSTNSLVLGLALMLLISQFSICVLGKLVFNNIGITMDATLLHDESIHVVIQELY